MVNAPCNSSLGCYGQLPQWLLEGEADWSGLTAASTDSYQSYINFRKFILESIPGSLTKTTFTPDWVNTYLGPNLVFLPNQDNWAYWNANPKYSPDLAYSIGTMATEILVSVKGPEAVMNLYQDVGTGMTFAQSFQKEFGLSWTDALPLIAKVISDEIQQNINN